MYDLFNQPPVIVHQHERGAENQQEFDKERPHFNRQCEIVFGLLMDGYYLDSRTGVEKHNIMDVRRRCKDLKDKGFKISEEKIPGGHGMKRFYMTDEDREYNKKIIS
jgi:hypothetical protein